MVTFKEIEKLITEMFSISKKLMALTSRPFTLDGHMLGSIGEVYAETYYNIKLYDPSHTGHDGKWKDREVQIKVTQRKSISLKMETDLLLVLLIKPDGSFIEIYNGDGKRPWNALSHRKISKAGEISTSLKQLEILNKQVQPADKIPKNA